MSTPMSEAEAFGILRTRRKQLEAAAAQSLQISGADLEAAARNAAILVDLMLAGCDNDVASRSDATAVPRRQIIAFGDSLVPLLKDFIGEPPLLFLARCVDAYWRGATAALDAA
ncbi:hypothetical protein ASD67_20670 [Sphingopyxis sp. Root1497]|uniref:hypothetical protein n=1 Tax=Sphingopyxis sp. Root1497 TaxID=1736474 RepID=UPI00071500FE|nr:hypothetical protein [Sphingopyxis sp. Root1497]KQZ61617.1 hypothetical protein ASD67_20670 [Sphingopyxis sp. Root1497]